MAELSTWILISIAAWYLMCFLFAYVPAKVGQFFGAKVERVSVGYALFTGASVTWEGKDWQWQFGLFPFGSSAKFLGLSDQDVSDVDWDSAAFPAGSFFRLSTLQKVVAVGSGSLICIATGLLLLFLPVILGANQIMLSTPADSTIAPVAVNGLRTEDAASTLAQQIDFVSDVLHHIIAKFLLFQSSDGWGGWLGSVVTLGAAGTNSAAAWSSCFGCILLCFGIIHLIPIPCLSGFAMLSFVADSIIGRNRTERVMIILTYLGLIYLIAVHIRVAIADIFWLIDMFKNPIAG